MSLSVAEAQKENCKTQQAPNRCSRGRPRNHDPMSSWSTSASRYTGTSTGTSTSTSTSTSTRSKSSTCIKTGCAHAFQVRESFTVPRFLLLRPGLALLQGGLCPHTTVLAPCSSACQSLPSFCSASSFAARRPTLHTDRPASVFQVVVLLRVVGVKLFARYGLGGSLFPVGM